MLMFVVSHLFIYLVIYRLAEAYEQGEDYMRSYRTTVISVTFFLLVATIKGITLAISSHVISMRFHDRMTNNVIRSPTFFFDSNPIGRILTRFTKDSTIIDRAMFNSIFVNSFRLAWILAFIISICISFSWFTPVALLGTVVYLFVRKFYVTALTVFAESWLKKKLR